MKASTLFALTVAALLGLGVAVGAKMLGYFEPRTAVAVEKNGGPYKVIVAKANLFEDMAINANQVTVRDLRPDEVEYYKANRDKFLSGSASAAALRIPKVNIEADQPILKEHLHDLAFPD